MHKKPEVRRYDVWVGIISVLLLAVAGASMYVPMTGTSLENAEMSSLDREVVRPSDTAAPSSSATGSTSRVQTVEPSDAREAREPVVAESAVESPAGSENSAESERTVAVEDTTAAEDRAASAALLRAREAARREEWTQALHLYASIAQEGPGRTEVRLERARVLSWAGRHDEAASEFEQVADSRSRDGDALLNAARNWWWAGSPGRAAEALDRYLGQHPDHREALDLRARVREALEPDPATAREWLEEGGGRAEQHLWLARAYARDGETELAVPHYREALLAGTFDDSLLLEYASVAERAGRVDLAIGALERYLDRRPADRDVLLRLARLQVRSGRTEEGLRTYQRLLESDSDRAVQFERAQTLAWSGSFAEARAALQKLVEDNPSDGAALALMGDIERWEGQPEEALEYYRRARQAGFDNPDLQEAVRLAESTIRDRKDAEEAPERMAGRDDSPRERKVGWQARTVVMGDSDDFRWVTVELVGPEMDLPGSLQFDAHRDFWSGRSLGGQSLRSGGWGVGARLTGDLGSRLEGSVRLGTHLWDDGTTEPEWAAGLRLRRASGGSTSLEYRRVPAVNRAFTGASLRSATVADVLRLRDERSLASSLWLSGYVQAERVGSELGSGDRLSAGVSVSRTIADRFTAGMRLAAVGSEAAAPLVEGWGRLFWTPDHYVAPELVFRYRQDLTPSLSLGMHFDPGYAFVREFPHDRRRYDGTRVPFVDTGMELTYTDDRWTMGVSGNWAGAIDAGYRAARFQFWITSTGGRR